MEVFSRQYYERQRNIYHELKVIRTEYNGISYRSKTEARWAVLLDLMGIPYSYEQEGYYLHDGYTPYTPDFKIMDGTVANAPGSDFFLEVKGEKAPGLAEMQKDFIQYDKGPGEKKGRIPHLYLVSDLPFGMKYYDFMYRWYTFYVAARRKTGESIVYDASMIDAKYPHGLAMLAINRSRKPELFTGKITADSFDIPRTLAAYTTAANAKFDREYRKNANLDSMLVQADKTYREIKGGDYYGRQRSYHKITA